MRDISKIIISCFKCICSVDFTRTLFTFPLALAQMLHFKSGTLILHYASMSARSCMPLAKLASFELKAEHNFISHFPESSSQSSIESLFSVEWLCSGLPGRNEINLNRCLPIVSWIKGERKNNLIYRASPSSPAVQVRGVRMCFSQL